MKMVDWFIAEAIKPEGLVLLAANFFAFWYWVKIAFVVIAEVKWTRKMKRKKLDYFGLIKRERVVFRRGLILTASAVLYVLLNPWWGIPMSEMGFYWPIVLYGGFFSCFTLFGIYNQHAFSIKEFSVGGGTFAACEVQEVIKTGQLSLDILSSMNSVLMELPESLVEYRQSDINLLDVLDAIVGTFLERANITDARVQFISEEDLPFCDDDFPDFSQDEFLEVEIEGNETVYMSEVDMEETVYIALVVDRGIIDLQEFTNAIYGLCAAVNLAYSRMPLVDVEDVERSL